MNEEHAHIARAQRGDDASFARLVEQYQTPVYNLCYRMLGDAPSAEDAAQETFLRAYQNLGKYDSARSFATWLLSIAAHYCIDRFRRRKFFTVSIDEDNEDEAPFELPDVNAVNPEAEFVRREEQIHLQKLLAALDPTDRAALILRYWHDCSEVEIASALGLTVSAVKSRMHRARKTLGKRWMAESPSADEERMAYGTPAF